MDKKHEIFQRDPAELMKYVHKHVVITTVDGTTHGGCVYTVDPVSSTFALMTYGNEATSIKDGIPKPQSAELVLGHAIQSVDIVDDFSIDRSTHMDLLFKSSTSVSFTKEELSKRRERLRSWLEENRFPVEMSENKPDIISVGGDVLLIQPPYCPENCLSTNGIILSRVQSLIARMPTT